MLVRDAIRLMTHNRKNALNNSRAQRGEGKGHETQRARELLGGSIRPGDARIAVRGGIWLQTALATPAQRHRSRSGCPSADFGGPVTINLRQQGVITGTAPLNQRKQS